MPSNKDNSYKYVGLSSEIPIGKSKSITIKDTASNKNINIAIFNISGRFYAISVRVYIKVDLSAKVFSTEIL